VPLKRAEKFKIYLDFDKRAKNFKFTTSRIEEMTQRTGPTNANARGDR
jgi:hypothetical protein